MLFESENERKSTLNPQLSVSEYFDELYGAAEPRYWWRHDEPYSADADAYPYSLLAQQTLRLIKDRPAGRALDLGAGEGADSIRLARLGYSVVAVEISNIGAEKIQKFADEAGVALNVAIDDISEYRPDGTFDLVICNGVLHYIPDKVPVIERMQRATRAGGINVISLWSTYTPVPECHTSVRVFCDVEDGVVTSMYEHWTTEFIYFDRGKLETSHSGTPPHSHSHIKIIARKPA